MADLTIENWRVADGAVRLILFRVLPSYELEVGRIIEDRCNKIGLAKDSFRVFRLFGSYDLVYIQDNASLSSPDFVKMGTIPYIMGTSEYVCYKWKHIKKRKPTLVMNKLNDTLLSLCFLKINPIVVQDSGIFAEIDFAQYIQDNLPNIQMVGTMGWFEIILILSASSLSRILDIIGKKLPNLIYRYRTTETQNQKFYFVEKTFTLVGHNLDVSDQKVTRTGSKVELFNKSLTRDDLSVHLTVSCKPCAMSLLEKSANKHFSAKNSPQPIDINFRFGSRDLDFVIPWDDITTLNQLLHKIDRFRSDNYRHLIRTYTDIQYRKHDHSGPSPNDDDKGRLIFNLNIDQAKHLINLGTEGAAVASAIYRYNDLIENDTIVDAFTDLLKFVQFTQNLALQVNGTLSVYMRNRFIDRLKILKDAINQRSQGVYAGIEESPFEFGFTGIGLSRVYKALEAYVILLLHRLSKEWNGFVVSWNSSRFEHQEEVIIVPSESSLMLRTHWAIAHEVMHVFQHIEPEILSAKNIFPDDVSPIISQYRITGSNLWLLLHEATADVLVYALCCPLKLDDYLTIIWSYLIDKVFEQQNEAQLKAYLFRSFAVICYDHQKTSLKSKPNGFSPNQIKAILKKKQNFWMGYSLLEPLYKKNSSNEATIELLIQKFVSEIGPALPYLFNSVEKIRERIEPPKIESNVSQTIFDQLQEGHILDIKYLRNPETIAWSMAQCNSTPISDKGNIAWTLSLWHLYHIKNLGYDLRNLMTKQTKNIRSKNKKK
jgi:hypothetical protein